MQGPALPREKLKGLMGLCDHPDKLNLAGLLNVLDGVVDCPNRIVVRAADSNKWCPAVEKKGDSGAALWPPRGGATARPACWLRAGSVQCEVQTGTARACGGCARNTIAQFSSVHWVWLHYPPPLALISNAPDTKV